MNTADNKSETIDILDNQGRVTSQSKTRDLIHKDGNWHQSIHLYILDKNNRVLFQRRSKDKMLFASMYACPVGGHIKSGAAPLSTLVKESLEEINLQIKTEDLTYLGIDRVGYHNPKVDLSENEFVHIYILNLDEEINLNVENAEVEGLFWFDFDDFKTKVRSKNEEFMPCWIIYEKIIDYVENLKKFI